MPNITAKLEIQHAIEFEGGWARRTWYDGILVYVDGEYRETLLVESSEDADPYQEAMRGAGYTEWTWLPEV